MVNPFLEERKRRLEITLRFLENEKEIPMSRLLGFIQYNFGVSKETAREYVTTLRMFEAIEVKDGIVRIKGGEA